MIISNKLYFQYYFVFLKIIFTYLSIIIIIIKLYWLHEFVWLSRHMSPIVYCAGLVLQTASCVHTELTIVSLSWLANTGVSMYGSQWVLPASPAVPCMSCPSYLDGLWDGRQVAIQLLFHCVLCMTNNDDICPNGINYSYLILIIYTHIHWFQVTIPIQWSFFVCTQSYCFK